MNFKSVPRASLVEETCPKCNTTLNAESMDVEVAGMYMRCPCCGEWTLLCSSACWDEKTENHHPCGKCPYTSPKYLLALYFTTKFDDVEQVINAFGCVNTEKIDGMYDVKYNEMMDILVADKKLVIDKNKAYKMNDTWFEELYQSLVDKNKE